MAAPGGGRVPLSRLPPDRRLPHPPTHPAPYPRIVSRLETPRTPAIPTFLFAAALPSKGGRPARSEKADFDFSRSANSYRAARSRTFCLPLADAAKGIDRSIF